MKTFCTFLLLHILLLAYGQSDFSLEPNPAYAEGSAGEDDFSANATIKNLTDHTIVVAWQRINNDIPSGWKSYLCSNITCAPPDISMGTFSITAQDSTNLDCYFVPEDIAGSGTVEFRLFLTDDTTQVIYATYNGDALPVSTEEPVTSEELQIYPNPANKVVFIKDGTYEYLKIFDTSGVLHAFSTYTSTINIENLQPGLYYFALYNQKDQLIATRPFLRANTK